MYINLPSSSADNYKEPVDVAGDLPATASLGDIRLVLDTGSLYYFDGSNWQPLTSGGGGGDAADITYTPADNADWSVVPNDVKDALDELASRTIDTQYKVEIFTLSAGQIAAKEVTLASTPNDPNIVILDPIDGIRQDPGIAFSVTGDVLSWDGFSLDGILEENDKIIVTYT